MRELAANVMHRRSKGIRPCVVERAKRVIACFTCGEGKHGIACRCITVDRDGVEGGCVGLAQNLLQKGGLNRGIGEDIAQHCRHIRRNHAAAFDNTDNLDTLSPDHRARFRAFGKSVCCADSICNIPPTAGRSLKRCIQAGFGFVLGQGYPDHTG